MSVSTGDITNPWNTGVIFKPFKRDLWGDQSWIYEELKEGKKHDQIYCMKKILENVKGGILVILRDSVFLILYPF